MRPLLVVCCLIVSLSFSLANDRTKLRKFNVTKLEPVDLDEDHVDSESKPKEAQKKRDSGYSYNRPDRVTSSHRYNPRRFTASQSGYRPRIVSRYPSHANRPFNKYGPPNHSSPFTKPSNQFSSHHQYDQQHREQLQQHHHGFLMQEVPSPIRNVDFVQPSPIASQNNEPFNSNAANYLPPGNQELPIYSVPDTFAPQQGAFQGQGHGTGFQSQNLVQGQDQQQSISDAAQFLAQNAQAISQLYGTPATDQNFAPNTEFQEQANQIQGQSGQFENLQSSTGQSQQFQGALPSYASGTLSVHESLEQIQSIEKDRLIAQLQQALLNQAQSQSEQYAGQYARNHGNYLQSQNSASTQFPSADKSSKFDSPSFQNPNLLTGSFGAPNTVFFSRTTPSSGFAVSYGLPSSTQAPTTPATTTTTHVPPVQSPQGPSGTGSNQVGTSSLPAPPPSYPQFGGFVPTFIGGTNVVANVPNYGPGFLGSGSTTTSFHPAENSPTHFGLPIPSNHPHIPVTPPRPPSIPPPAPPPPVGIPAAAPIHPISVPIQPVHPIAAPAPPIVSPIHPVAAPVQPILPTNPVLTQLHPVQTPVATPGQPTYGIQSAVINPLLYKPIKAVYPIYYYPNLNYQLQKPNLSTYPWSYAPSYPQAKPAYNWK